MTQNVCTILPAAKRMYVCMHACMKGISVYIVAVCLIIVWLWFGGCGSRDARPAPRAEAGNQAPTSPHCCVVFVRFLVCFCAGCGSRDARHALCAETSKQTPKYTHCWVHGCMGVWVHGYSIARIWIPEITTIKQISVVHTISEILAKPYRKTC